MQISFITREMQKEREKPPQPEAALPLNNLNKMNRNNRSSHPYLSNSSRRSPVRGTVQDLTDSTGASETEVIFSQNYFSAILFFIFVLFWYNWQVLDNAQTAENSLGSARVSSAFHEHLNRHRESLMSQQSRQCDANANHARLVSFQDVRNHFDQQPTKNSNSSRQTPCSNNKKNSNDHKKTNVETDWEEIFHRCRRYDDHSLLRNDPLFTPFVWFGLGYLGYVRITPRPFISVAIVAVSFGKRTVTLALAATTNPWTMMSSRRIPNPITCLSHLKLS